MFWVRSEWSDCDGLEEWISSISDIGSIDMGIEIRVDEIDISSALPIPDHGHITRSATDKFAWTSPSMSPYFQARSMVIAQQVQPFLTLEGEAHLECTTFTNQSVLTFANSINVSLLERLGDSILDRLLYHDYYLTDDLVPVNISLAKLLGSVIDQFEVGVQSFLSKGFRILFDGRMNLLHQECFVSVVDLAPLFVEDCLHPGVLRLFAERCTTQLFDEKTCQKSRSVAPSSALEEDTSGS